MNQIHSDDIKELTKRICGAGAEAIRRYANMSGLEPTTLPEYFMTSIIADKLFVDYKNYVTLETSVAELRSWSPRKNVTLLSNQEARAETDIKRWKADMTVFSPAETPEQSKILAVVEVKRGYIAADLDPNRRTDRSKALRIMETVACDYVVLCGSLSRDHRDYHKKKASEFNDLWMEADVTDLPYAWPDGYFFGARVLDVESIRNSITP